MQANHLDICKFDDAQDDGYKQVRAKIEQAIKATCITEANEVRGCSNKILLIGTSQ